MDGKMGKKMTIPLAVAVPLGVAIVSQGKNLMAGQYDSVVLWTTGYNKATKQFLPAYPIATYAPVVLGLVIHKIANLSGLNRMLGNMKIPIVRV